MPAAQAIRIGREFAQNAEDSGGRSMIILGAGTNHWFHSDIIYRTFLAMITLTGCQGVNGGGWAHYVGQEKVRPITGWANLAFALDWQRPARQMIGTAFWYVNTDQWRYDNLGAGLLATPLGEGRFENSSMIDTIAQSARSGWMPSFPSFNRNPIEIVARGAGSRHRPARVRQAAIVVRRSEVRDRGSRRPGELAARTHLVAGQPARLLQQGQRVLPQAPTGHEQRRARRGDLGPLRPGRVARGRPGRQTRSAGQHRLPDDLVGLVRGHPAAGGDLVREARPVQHGHAPVRARLHPGDRPALGDQERLRHLRRPGTQGFRSRAGASGHCRGPDGDPADARHRRRDGCARWGREGLAHR